MGRIAVIGYRSEIERGSFVATSVADYIAMAEQYPFAISAEAKDDTAEIRINGVIHQWNNSAAWFRQQIASFNEKGIKKAKLFINTPGGSVFEAAEIRNELEAFEGEIHGIGGAIVASAGTYIRLGCKTFEMVKNGQFMYHKPIGSIRGNEDTWESQLVLLKNLTSEYRKEYAKLTGLSEKEIESRWSKGDVWMNAEQAKKEKFITGVLAYRSQITEKETAMFTACGAPEIPKATKPKTKSNVEMDLKVTALSLGLKEDATEAEVKAELARVKAKADKADQLEQAAKDKEKADRAKEIKAVTDKAIADKRLTAKQAEGLQAFAESDFEAFKAHVEGLPAMQKVSEQINGKTGSAAGASKDKKFADMSAEERDTLEQEDPEAFAAKYEEYLNEE